MPNWVHAEATIKMGIAESTSRIDWNVRTVLHQFKSHELTLTDSVHSPSIEMVDQKHIDGAIYIRKLS